MEQQARFITPSLQAEMTNLPQGPTNRFAGLYFPVPTSAPCHYLLNAQAHEHSSFAGDGAELTLNARGAGAVIFAPTASLGHLGTAWPQSSIHQLLWVPAPLRSAGEKDWAFPGAPEAPHLPSIPVSLPGSFSISHASSIGCEDEEVSPVSAWCWARR